MSATLHTFPAARRVGDPAAIRDACYLLAERLSETEAVFEMAARRLATSVSTLERSHAESEATRDFIHLCRAILALDDPELMARRRDALLRLMPLARRCD